MTLPKLIENKRILLSQTIRDIAKEFRHLSISTGYWDILGTKEILESLKNYESIRLLIGQEPLYNPYINNINIEKDFLFPDHFFKKDLEDEFNNIEIDSIRETAKQLTDLIQKGVLKVKVFRHPRLHAKAYIFGDYNSSYAIGIVGSSNFTSAGLTSNAELNAVESDFRVVSFKPVNETQEHGYLSWFDSFWNSEDAVDWSGDFQELIETSPVGGMTYGAYDVYIKTLMEVYPDELLPPAELSNKSKDVLYSFQNRNAGILVNKLNRMKLAILSDSVGLGKTITGGAVIKHYLDRAKGKANIQIIAPASLKQQWEDDLSSVLGLERIDGAFDIVSQQDTNAIQRIYDHYNKEWRKSKSIDLFVVDEAHNLRTRTGTRYETILKLFKQHPEAHILLLTATPINNSLMDIANLIQIASKGSMVSVNVAYKRPNESEVEMLDFFTALKRIQSAIRRAEKNGDNTEDILNQYKSTIHSGLRHYLVRSTRQGVEAEGGIIDKSGNKRAFPVSRVESIEYEYKKGVIDYSTKELESSILPVFESIKVRSLDLDFLSQLTQMTSHPLDFFKKLLEDKSFIGEYNSNLEDLNNNSIYMKKPVESLIANLLQVIFTLGFTPYRPLVYMNKFYSKSINEIRAFESLPDALPIQLTVHNILQITWLKRLESSPTALLISISNYKNRIRLFEKYLNRGYIISLNDASMLENYYNDGEDIEQAFIDFDNYLKDRENLLSDGQDPNVLKKMGVHRRKADESEFNLKQLRLDLEREIRILDVLSRILEYVSKPENDIKMNNLYQHIRKTLESNSFGKKVLVFSFFSDTIKHLENNFYKYFEDQNIFKEKSAFITGQSVKIEQQVRCFSPVSKKYKIAANEKELDYLFATDVLSEGQNLQDAAYLINYDLHWNPVRMIQRNGRINRLGSNFDKVMIGNMKPGEDLELYLNLVHRLENKIKTIRNTVGLDQGILDDRDINPIEFIEKYYEKGELPEVDDDLLAHTDEHILALRRFLGENLNNQKEILRVQSIPKGKWNYLPSESRKHSNTLALVKVNGETLNSHQSFEDLFFVEVSTKNEKYLASYLDYPKALDRIKADPSENHKIEDVINIDRSKVKSRASAEAKRQANNPESRYTLTPQYLNALGILVPYFSSEIDFKGVIETGVSTIDVQARLESVLRKVRSEHKNNGTIYASTLKEFEDIFNEIKDNVVEEKEVRGIEISLYYAGLI